MVDGACTEDEEEDCFCGFEDDVVAELLLEPLWTLCEDVEAEDVFEVLESEEAGMEAVRLETADDTELVCCDIVEEDSREKVDVEDEEEANKAFS